jgi:N-methylhydantoinase A
VKSQLRPRFDAEHERRFGHSFDETNEVEIVALKVHATDPVDQAPDKLIVPPAEPLNFERDVYFGESFGVVATAVIGRGEVPVQPSQGPLIVEEFEGTTVVPPDAWVHRDTSDNIVIDLEY